MPQSPLSDPSGVAELAQELLSRPGDEATAQRVVDLAVKNVPGCSLSSITIKGAMPPESPAFSDPLASTLDLWQYELEDGPCLNAADDGNIHRSGDLAHETRWHTWSLRACTAGIQSVLSVRLSTPDRVLGSLNLYGRDLDAFGHDSVDIGAVYARIAAGALFASHHAAGLHAALDSRNVIGIAQGLLMQQYQLSRNQSFEVLRRRSQETNTKLRDLAAQLVEEHQHLGQDLSTRGSRPPNAAPPRE